MLATSKGASERADKERRRTREEIVKSVILHDYVIERIVREARKKAATSKLWNVEVRLNWIARFALQASGMQWFTEHFVQAELKRRGYTVPVRVDVIGAERSFVQHPFRAFISVSPVASY